VREYILYKITNKITNSHYIGYTEKSINERFKRHLSLARSGKGYYLHSAIRKYGESNFSISELYRSVSLKEMRSLEIQNINCLNTFAPNGYNIHIGGLGGDTLSRHPDIDKIKVIMSEKHLLTQKRGSNHPRYHRYNDDIRKKVVDMYFSFEMYSPLAIIKECSLSSRDVFSRIIKESGNKLYRSFRERFKFNKSNLDKLYNLYLVEKLTVREISQLTNLGEDAICFFIKTEFSSELGSRSKLRQNKKLKSID
jgi:group I intron endonuclease